MRKVFSILAATMFAGAAWAEAPAMGPVWSGEVELKFTQDANDDWGGAMGLDLGVDAAGLASVDLDFSATDGNAVALDNWTVGTTVNSIGIAIGDDNGVMPDAEGNHTLAAPAMAESVKVTAGSANVALGFSNWSSDITDLSNIQGSYDIDAGVAQVTAGLDYNLDSENTVLGAGVAGIDLGVASASGAFTYDMDASTWGYEAGVKNGGMVAYFNGDDTETFQNVGGGYDYTVANGVVVGADVAYNLNDETFTPKVTASFSF